MGDNLPVWAKEMTISFKIAIMARLEGFEPPAFWSVAKRSIQLS